MIAAIAATTATPVLSEPSTLSTPFREQSPLPGTNAISGFRVFQKPTGQWIAELDYFYTGEPRHARLQIDVQANENDAVQPKAMVAGEIFWGELVVARRGSHHVSVELKRPSMNLGPITTRAVLAHLLAPAAMPPEQVSTAHGSPAERNVILAGTRIVQHIEWPDYQTWTFEREYANKTPKEIFSKAVALIDTEDTQSIRQAKTLLERLIKGDQQFDEAYVELARVAMKLNWGPEGLHQAETLLQSALQSRPGSTNAMILMAYVHTNQGRTKAAEALFEKVKDSGTKNLWLWTNWGDLLAQQGKSEQAAAMYQKALAVPPTRDTYDRARLFAYKRLFSRLEKKHDYDAIEKLYAKRAEEYGPGNCFGAEYSRFVLSHRDRPQVALTLAQEAVNNHCTDRTGRDVLGLAYYVVWERSTAGADRNQLLSQARINLPAGPKPLYLLATSDRTASAAAALIKSGEAIDQRDNQGFTALALAIGDRDYAAARRLMRLGAKVDATVGPGEMPLALMPIVMSDVDGIRTMREAGVDYSRLRFRGISAIDLARREGTRKVIEALTSMSRPL